ncbi:MAG TPA: choice-of-anchor tandem repeat NxxGxxAF-containing protein [Lacipirellulaceae bacterium]|nr:choice-of-anchor tandem repeat NxxGxxAF-containing protein [Lacipirellulaceae bacterium]
MREPHSRFGFASRRVFIFLTRLRARDWAQRSGSVEKVAYESETAPGTGSMFDQIRTDTFAIGTNNEVTFESSIADGRSGLFSDSGGLLHAIALTDTPASDSGDATISNIVRWTANDLGQVAFMAQLDGPGFPDVIFATDRNGVLHRIIGQGDTIEVAPGDLGQIEFLNFMGLDGSFGMSGTNVTSGFDNDGQIAFSATLMDGDFNDTSGVFVTTVPEPSLDGDYNHDGIVDAAD